MSEKANKGVACPVCGEERIYSVECNGWVTYVSNYEYERSPIEQGLGTVPKGKEAVECLACGHEWDSCHEFCVDWNNKFRFNEPEEDGGWASHAAWALGESKNIKDFLSALKFGVGIDLTDEQYRAIWDKLQQYHEEKDKSEEN